MQTATEPTSTLGNLVVINGGLDVVEEFSFDELVREAYRQLEVARRNAQMILTNARLEAADICWRAREEGSRLVEEALVQAETEAHARAGQIESEARARGREEGLRQAEAETRGALTRARLLGERLETAFREHLRDSERELVETVLAISKKVLGVEQDAFRQCLGAAIHQVLADHAHAREVTLHVHPGDYEGIVSFLGERPGVNELVTSVRANSAVAAGTCKFRSAHFNLDLSLERRFEQVRASLREQWTLATGRSRE